jgi:hypothetical protein
MQHFFGYLHVNRDGVRAYQVQFDGDFRGGPNSFRWGAPANPIRASFSGCPEFSSPEGPTDFIQTGTPHHPCGISLYRYKLSVNLWAHPRSWGFLERVYMDWRGVLLTSSPLPFLPFRASLFSTWGLEIAG